MKMVMIVHYAPITEEVMEALERLGVKTYTRIPQVQGVGGSSNPRFDSHIWPGFNNIIFTVVEDKKAKELVEAIRGLKDRFREEGIKAFILSIEDMV